MSDSGGDDGASQSSGGEAPPELPASIARVWDHPLIVKETSDDGQKEIWRCLAPGCDKTWNGHNGTKALAHGSKIRAFCQAHNIRTKMVRTKTVAVVMNLAAMTV